MPDWQDLMPGEDASKLGETAMIEREAVRRIVIKAALPDAASCTTFDQLVAHTSIPYQLVAHKFGPKALDDLEVAMLRWPSKSALMMAMDEIVDLYPHEDVQVVGMVFPWRGRGGLHVFTYGDRLPYTVGASGRFWRLRDGYYLLEPIDSFIERLGPAEDW